MFIYIFCSPSTKFLVLNALDHYSATLNYPLPPPSFWHRIQCWDWKGRYWRRRLGWLLIDKNAASFSAYILHCQHICRTSGLVRQMGGHWLSWMASGLVVISLGSNPWWMRSSQGVTKRCRLSWLTKALSYMSPNAGGGGSCGPQPMRISCTQEPE